MLLTYTLTAEHCLLLRARFVSIQSGWDTSQEFNELGAVGAAYANTVSLRYGVKAQVAKHSATGTRPFGMLLYDVRETDENGEKLIYKPRKAAEMQCAISGQAVPVVRRGMFLYSGIAGTPTAGAAAYANWRRRSFDHLFIERRNWSGRRCC